MYTYANKRSVDMMGVGIMEHFPHDNPAWWSHNLSGAWVINSHVLGFLLVPCAGSKAHILRLRITSRWGRKGWTLWIHSSKCPFSISCGFIEPSIFRGWWWVHCEGLIHARGACDGRGGTRRGGWDVSIILHAANTHSIFSKMSNNFCT